MVEESIGAMGEVAVEKAVQRKTDTHLVIKRSDIDKYLSYEEKKELLAIVFNLEQKKLKDSGKTNSYYICNVDEPYAEKVLSTILEGEKEKLL